MSYFIRVLGKTNPAISVNILERALESNNLKASFDVQDGTSDDWTQVIVRDKKGRDLFMIEKNEVVDGELGMDELEEFRDEISDCQPSSAVEWLDDYFDEVKVIYAFQILGAVDDDESWTIVGEVKTAIWNETKGILQADDEGFSNEDGYHILWQFSDSVTGEWYMAVMDPKGGWTRFKMDLGDEKQREEFFRGEVPSSAELV